ncbi:hypothetical protein FM125_02760 [Micrococcus lylae]|uniref:Uncharacterized protein n=2 Tax=Micrococcus lylae TaxID=1273 RepID=A0A1R4IJ42_9MICC|nr:hypothetical protein FM125_02760 [Micrococcus lylae]
MLDTMSLPQTGAHPDPDDPHFQGRRAPGAAVHDPRSDDPAAHDPYARERAYPAPPLRGPSVGLWRVPVVWAVTLAFLAIPVIVVTLRAMNGLAGWMMLLYIMLGVALQAFGGLAVGLSLLMLPRVNTVHERRSGIRLGAPLTVLLCACWAAGVAGPAILPDAGDAPESAVALPVAEQLWGYDLAAEITMAVGLTLAAVSLLCGAAAVLLCLVRRLRAPAADAAPMPAPVPARATAAFPHDRPEERR